jgi:hypothetical protein
MSLYDTATTLNTNKSTFSCNNTISTIGNSLIPSLIPTFLLSAIITINPPTHPSNQYSDSAVSYKRDIVSISNLKESVSTSYNNEAKESIISFSNELYRRSRSMTDEEYSSVRNMILSIANPGLPRF